MAIMTPEQRKGLIHWYFARKFPDALPQIQELVNKPVSEVEELTGEKDFFASYANHALTIWVAHQVQQMAVLGRRGKRTGLMEDGSDCLESAVAAALAIPAATASILALPVLRNLKQAVDAIKKEFASVRNDTSYPRLDDGLANLYCTFRSAAAFSASPEPVKRAASGDDYRRLAQKVKQTAGPAAQENQVIVAWLEHEFAMRQLEQLDSRLKPCEQHAAQFARAPWLSGAPPANAAFDRKLLRALVRSPLAESEWASELNKPSFFMRIRQFEDQASLLSRRALLEWSQYESEQVDSGKMEGTLTETTGKFSGGGKQLDLKLISANPYFMEATWTPDALGRNPMMFFGRLE